MAVTCNSSPIDPKAEPYNIDVIINEQKVLSRKGTLDDAIKASLAPSVKTYGRYGKYYGKESDVIPFVGENKAQKAYYSAADNGNNRDGLSATPNDLGHGKGYGGKESDVIPFVGENKSQKAYYYAADMVNAGDGSSATPSAFGHGESYGKYGKESDVIPCVGENRGQKAYYSAADNGNSRDGLSETPNGKLNPGHAKFIG